MLLPPVVTRLPSPSVTLSTFVALRVNSAKGLARSPACHPEYIRYAQGQLGQGSGTRGHEMLRFAQHDKEGALSMIERYLPASI